MCVCERWRRAWWQGAIHFKNGAFSATWEDGRPIDGRFTFSDGLEYTDPPAEWSYCVPSDRRFYTEVKGGILPAGETQLLDRRPAPAIPAGCFDAGDGYYDPKRGEILDYGSGEVVRKARADDVAWIARKCAYGDGGGVDAALRRALASR